MYGSKKKVKTYKKKPFKKFSQRKPVIARNPNVHYFKRTAVNQMTITTPAAVGSWLTAIPSSGTTQFNEFILAQVPNYLEFRDMYDTYKICGIKVKYVLDVDSANTGTVSNVPGSMPTLITVNDYNDSTAVTSETDMLQYKTYKSTRMNYPITRYFRPTQKIEATGSTGVVKSRWNPTLSNPEHHGLKAAVIGYNFTADSINIGRLRIYTTFYLGMKTPI